MRIWGRVYSADKSSYSWVAQETDAQGNNDYVYITNLIQVLKLSRNESPFYANYGIPAQLSLIQQIAPDLYVAETQAQFAPFFAALLIAKIASNPPTYKINLTTNQGTPLELLIPVADQFNG
jgi:hypothetical protein